MLYQNTEVQKTELDISLGFDTVNREELILEQNEIRMCQLLLSETSTTLRFGKDFTESLETNEESTQRDAISGVFFDTTFGHMLRLYEKTPCQMTMTDYFQIPPNSKRYPGRKKCTLPFKTNEN